jgi:hypothetical protein
MIQACLIRDSVSGLQNESRTEDWTQISGPFFDSGANAQQLHKICLKIQ